MPRYLEQSLSDTAIRRRLAAIMAADVVGYSRLMAADEIGTVARLEAARSVFKTRSSRTKVALSTRLVTRCLPCSRRP